MNSLEARLILETAKVAAAYWAEQLEQGDKAIFTEFLTNYIAGRLQAQGCCILESDYDPKGALLAAVRVAGIECKGSECSSRGILPMKLDTLIRPGVIDNTGYDRSGGGPLLIGIDEGNDDHSVLVVAKLDARRNFEILSIKQLEKGD